MEHTNTNQNEFFINAFQKNGLTIVGAKNKEEHTFWMLRLCKEMISRNHSVSILSRDLSQKDFAERLFSPVHAVSPFDPNLKKLNISTKDVYLFREIEERIQKEVSQKGTKVFFFAGYDDELTHNILPPQPNKKEFLNFCEKMTKIYDIHIVICNTLFLSSSRKKESPSLYHFRVSSSLLCRFHNIIRLEATEEHILQTLVMKPKCEFVFKESFAV